MIEFSDFLYGRICLPDWINPFLRIPEFVRLRGIRLSNVDSIDFKDFGSASRWEHGIAVAYLAWRCGEKRRLSRERHAELTLAALLHDVATPPFAHTAERVIEGYDHELETYRLLGGIPSENLGLDTPVFGSSLPQFRNKVEALARDVGLKIDPDEVARMVVGDGELGFLISGSLDLDNADNVIRGCALMGMDVDRRLPERVADWLAGCAAPPIDLSEQASPVVGEWLSHRTSYYERFLSASENELGREAFLQHLMRRAMDSGLPRQALIWKTDETLLLAIEALEESPDRRRSSLRELVERYRLLEPTTRLASVEIEDTQTLRVLRQPQALSWIEKELGSKAFEPFVLLVERRFQAADLERSLFPPALGSLLIFKLGSEVHHKSMPEWLRERIPSHLSGASLRRALTVGLASQVHSWANTKPWLLMTKKRKVNIASNLDAAGDWSFRLSRNESLHAYPSTFVHAIPASLISSLGLRGELVLDPFGGTGQTAAEAIKYEGSAISADSNTIATLVAQARFTPLSSKQRSWMAGLAATDILDSKPADPPEFELRAKWHHPRTLDELCRVWSFIQDTRDKKCRTFLTACFSAIIPATTARKGKQHGFFADNTPLSANETRPPYSGAAELFVTRVTRNLDIISRYYAALERDGRDPEIELTRVQVLRLDARIASSADYGVPEGSLAGIITSPPYLCMADYTLGQRLSYYWISPESLSLDFEAEIGSRRQRTNPKLALQQYFDGIDAFASRAQALLRPGGFLATVLAKPVAQAFRSKAILKDIDEILVAKGFDLFWDRWRSIHWHRNQGYQRLLRERVAVHVRR